MNIEIVFSGFGGQGVMMAAQVLAYAAMIEGKEVAWIPTYGPEMRGGAATAAVIIAEERIGSLSVTEPNVAAIMNQPSLDKYEGAVRPGGCIIVNRSITHRPIIREDIIEVDIRANDLAQAMGNDRLANMIMLGAVLGATRVVSLEAIEMALAKTLAGKSSSMLQDNQTAVRKGLEACSQAQLASMS